MEPKTFIKTLSILHISLIVGLVLFSIIAYAHVRDFNTSVEKSGLFLYIVPVAALLGYFGSQFVFRRMLAKLTISDSLELKLKAYKTAIHVKYALLEVPAILAILAYYVSGNALPLVIAISLMAYLFVQRPTIDTILKELPLDDKEKKQFENP